MILSQAPQARLICPRCRRAASACLCTLARPFQVDPLFVILIHPREAKRTIGTARLVKLCIQDTLLIEGTGPTLDKHPALHSVLDDPALDPFVLFPGPSSVPVEHLSPRSGRRVAILVVDGTWPQARKMIHTSKRLSSLPRLAFQPSRESGYGFRKQPAPHCLSTLEAVHEVISRLPKPSTASDRNDGETRRPQDTLLELFGELVRQQLAHSPGASA